MSRPSRRFRTRWSLVGPAHVNVCFAEPLLAGWAAAPESARGPGTRARAFVPRPARHTLRGSAQVETFLSDVRAPLVIVGGLEEPDDRTRVASFCQAIGAPVMAEASSGLRGADGLRLLRTGDAAARHGFEHHAFDSVIRIGDVPSWRTWRDLDAARPVPVLSVSRKPWRGLTRGTHIRVPEGMPLPLPASRAVAAERDLQALIWIGTAG